MEIEKLNIYKRLRDFNVPAFVLDDIFSNEQDLDVLIKGWNNLQKDGFKEIKPCKNCFYPRKMEESESALINGREVKIESYINRAQEVGK